MAFNWGSNHGPDLNQSSRPAVQPVADETEVHFAATKPPNASVIGTKVLLSKSEPRPQTKSFSKSDHWIDESGVQLGPEVGPSKKMSDKDVQAHS